MLLYAKKSFKKMYPVAKNYFGGLLQAHSFSDYVPTFAFSDHVEMKGRSKPLTHPECRSTRSKQQREAAARPNSVLVAPFRVALQTYYVAPFGVARPKGTATPPSHKCSPYWLWHTMARQNGSVAPTPLVREAYFVAPLCAQAQ